MQPNLNAYIPESVFYLLTITPVSVVLHMIHIQRTQLAVTVTPAPDLAAHTVSEGLT